MKKTFKTIVRQIGVQGVLAASMLVSGAFAADSSSAQFLKLGAGARAAGMADAVTAVADDVTAAYWNPAGLAQLDSAQISVMQNSSLLDTQYQYLAGAMPYKSYTLALSLYRMSYGSIEGYDLSGNANGSFDANSMAGAFTLGAKVNSNLDFGFTLKLIQESIENEKASGFAGDVGFIYHAGQNKLGLSFQHMGSGLKFVQEKGSLPQTIRAGASRKLSDNLLAAVDVSKPSDTNASIHGGLEYKVNPLLTLRGGYKATSGNSFDVDGLTGVTAGLGININRFSLDYGFVPFGELGNTHRISLLVRFDRP